MKPLKIESGVQIPRKRFDWSTNCQIGENDWKSNLQEMINKLLLNVKESTESTNSKSSEQYFYLVE